MNQTLTLFDQMKLLNDFNKIKYFDKSVIVPLIGLFSFDISNLGICMKLNKYLPNLKSEIVPYILHFQIKNKKIQHSFAISKPKNDNSELDFVYNAVQQLYQWSDREMKLNKQIIDMLLQDYDYKKMLDRKFAFDEKQCEILGL